MGEGLERKALEVLQEAGRSGKWVTLKNLHLVTNWLVELSQFLQSMEIEENFR